MPKRIQRKRTKGWRMPPGAVYVGRGSAWGNPYTGPDAVEQYQAYASSWSSQKKVKAIRALRGKDLACWCKLSEKCHADILLKIANEGGQP